MNKLNPKQEAFCREYLLDSNGTQAAIRAGYSEKTANEQAAQHLAKLSIKERIAELRIPIAAKFETTLAEVLTRIDKVGKDEDHKDHLKANDMLVKTLGGYVDKVEMTSYSTVELYAPKKNKDK